MPEAVVPCCWSRLSLLLLFATAGCDSGVDLIARASHSFAADAIIRQRLIALEQRFVAVVNDPCAERGLLIVFLQLGSSVDEDEDSLALVVETFTREKLTERIVFRVEKEEDAADMLATINRVTGNDSSCIVVIMMLPDLATSEFFMMTARAFPLALKLILLADEASSGECPGEEDLSSARSLLTVLWRTEQIIRAVMIWYRCSIALTIGLLDLFKTEASETSNVSWGTFYTLTDLNQPLPTDLDRFGRSINLQQMPLDIYGFEAAMAYRRKDIDMMPTTFPTLRPGAINSSTELLDGVFGADVEALRELTCRMNFTPRVHHTRANFGFKMANGTFTGVLGRLMSRESWLSMNVYFLKDYETRELQFSAGIYQDSLCVFVQAAGMLSKQTG
uniref:Ionotropic glutamate receptor L-glutamate and glycine-binding domain-containing protein n=1 Tax=Anopheles stephensi TaxID=30069 RepID=A0A182YH92_ANOST